MHSTTIHTSVFWSDTPPISSNSSVFSKTVTNYCWEINTLQWCDNTMVKVWLKSHMVTVRGRLLWTVISFVKDWGFINPSIHPPGIPPYVDFVTIIDSVSWMCCFGALASMILLFFFCFFYGRTVSFDELVGFRSGKVFTSSFIVWLDWWSIRFTRSFSTSSVVSVITVDRYNDYSDNKTKVVININKHNSVGFPLV